jgi:hypothetical protein
MTATDHLSTGIPFTSAVNRSLGEPCGCDERAVLFGRGQNTELGWSDPMFWALSRPKPCRGRSSPVLKDALIANGVLPAQEYKQGKETLCLSFQKYPRS